MTGPTQAILNDLADTLRRTGAFARVAFDEAPADTACPRAILRLEGIERFTPDDRPTGVWNRLRATATLHARLADAAEPTAGLARLADQAADALLDRPDRGGLCADLPIGRATEIPRIEARPLVARPYAQFVLTIRCHFEQSPQEQP